MDRALLTKDGTEVFEPSPEEYAEYLETQARALCGMAVDAFRDAFEAGDVDGDDPRVSELAALLQIGQNSRL